MSGDVDGICKPCMDKLTHQIAYDEVWTGPDFGDPGDSTLDACSRGPDFIAYHGMGTVGPNPDTTQARSYKLDDPFPISQGLRDDLGMTTAEHSAAMEAHDIEEIRGHQDEGAD